MRWKKMGNKEFVVKENDMIDLDKLNNLGYTSISLEVYGTRRNLEYIDQEIDKFIDEQDIINKYIISVNIEIFASNSGAENREKIGFLNGNFFESGILTDDTDFYTLCNLIGFDLESMAAAIVDEDGWIRDEICELDENLMYIDRIYIEEKYRGLGIASYVLNSIKQILIYAVNLYPNVLILLPKPQEKDKEGHLQNIRDKNIKDKNKKKLIKLYQNLGFEKLPDSDYMIKRLDEEK